MADASTQMGAALSTPIVQSELGQDIQFPQEAQGLYDVMKNSQSPRREKLRQIREIYEFMKGILSDYDEFLNQSIEDYNDGELDFDKEKVVDQISEKNVWGDTTGQILDIREEKMLENHPGVVNNLINHNNLSKAFLRLGKELQEHGELKELVSNQEEINDKESFKLGFFLGLEPLFVVAVLWADRQNDTEFLNNYQKLFDRFSFHFTREFRELFEKSTEFNKLKLSDSKVEEIVNMNSERKIKS